jgi:hypothetical protein
MPFFENLAFEAKNKSDNSDLFWKSANFFLIDAPEFELARKPLKMVEFERKIIFGHFHQLSIFWC